MGEKASVEGVEALVELGTFDEALEAALEPHPHHRAVDGGVEGVGVCLEAEEMAGPHPQRHQSLHRRA